MLTRFAERALRNPRLAWALIAEPVAPPRRGRGPRHSIGQFEPVQKRRTCLDQFGNLNWRDAREAGDYCDLRAIPHRGQQLSCVEEELMPGSE